MKLLLLFLLLNLILNFIFYRLGRRQGYEEADREHTFPRLTEAIAPVPSHLINPDVAPPQASGRIVRLRPTPHTAAIQPTTGGRVVKAMPKQLRKMKEAQERDDAKV